MITGVKYVCSRGTSGYAEVAKDYIIGLHNQGIPISVDLHKVDDSLFEIGERNEIVNSLVDKKIKYNKLIIHTIPEHWEKFIKKYKTKGVEVIGVTVWETDLLYPLWPKFINEADKVIVPCKWNKEVFLKSAVHKPIEVIPHIYKPTQEVKGLIKGIEPDDFVFYCINNWTVRKGMRDTITAYLNAFTSKDKVALVLKTYKNAYTEEENQKIRDIIKDIVKKYKTPAKIILLFNQMVDEQISALHNIGHCFVSLTKSEGFGLGLFEAAGLGKPVICTGFGGQTDFIANYLVDYKMVSVDGMPWIKQYRNDQHWAQPDIKHASYLMKMVYENYPLALSFAKNQQENIINNFNSRIVTNKLIKFLNE